MARHKFDNEDRIKQLLREQVVDLIENGWLRGFTIDTRNKFDEEPGGRDVLREVVVRATLDARDKDGAHVEICWTRTVGR